jgi:hypothetical protein
VAASLVGRDARPRRFHQASVPPGAATLRIRAPSRRTERHVGATARLGPGSGRPPPPPRPTGIGVGSEGVDLDDLSRRRENDGAVEGWAALTGVWNGQHLEVTDQRAEEPHGQYRKPRWDTRPCPPPPDGWPQVPEGSNIKPPPQVIPGQVSVVLFRPGPTQVVLVVASSEPDQAEALLRPLYGAGVCVVRSRWTAHQVQAVRVLLRQHWGDWTIFDPGNRIEDDAQLTVSAKVVHITRGIVPWARSLPHGLSEVIPWLRPPST